MALFQQTVIEKHLKFKNIAKISDAYNQFKLTFPDFDTFIRDVL